MVRQTRENIRKLAYGWLTKTNLYESGKENKTTSSTEGRNQLNEMKKKRSTTNREQEMEQTKLETEQCVFAIQRKMIKRIISR